jgi:hypothetical protein
MVECCKRRVSVRVRCFDRSPSDGFTEVAAVLEPGTLVLGVDRGDEVRNTLADGKAGARTSQLGLDPCLQVGSQDLDAKSVRGSLYEGSTEQRPL